MKMRIFILTPVYFPITGGVSNVVRQLYHKAKSFGDSALIMTEVGSVSEESADSEVIRLCIPDVLTLRDGFIAYLRSILLRRRAKQKIKALIKKFDIELVHIHCPVPKFVNLVSLNTPVLITYHSSDVLQLYTQFYKYLAKMNEQALFITAVSGGLIAELLNIAPVLAAKILRIPNGKVSTDEIKDGCNSREKNSSYIFCAADLIPRKATDLVVRAFATLSDCDNTILYIAGDGPERTKISALIKNLGIEPRVKLLGALSRIETVKRMKEAEVFILPSRREGLPLVILEAMSVGCPVIASAISGNAELVKHGENGYLFEPENIHALTECIRKIVSDKKTREQLSAGALRFAESYPTWDEVYLQYRNVYTKMLEEFRQ